MKFNKYIIGALALSTGVVAHQVPAQTLNIGLPGELASFDTSHVIGSVWESQVLMDVYEGLVKLSPSGELLPGMATSWEISKDGKTYTFHMRDGAKWSDGTPVTADDFVFGWQHLMDPKQASQYAYILYPVVNAQAVNEGKMPLDKLGVKSLDNGKTFQVQLQNPAPYFLQLMTHYSAYPQPRHLFEKYGKDWVNLKHIATNGAFKPIKWISQSYIRVTKNPNYYDADKVALDGVTYHDIQDLNATVTRFRAGELDISTANGFPASRLGWLKENMPKETHSSPYLGNEYYVFNERKGRPTADPRVRKALSLAVRRDVLAKSIMKGSFFASNAFVPDGIKGYAPQSANEMSEDYAKRLTEAKKLMQEAGYGPDHPLKLSLRFNSDEEHRQVAVAISAMWKALNVQTDLSNSESTVYYQSLPQGDFDIARAGWVADYNDPQAFLSLLLADSGNNYGKYSNPVFDKLMQQSDAELDESKRYQLLEQAEKTAMEDYAIMPLMTNASRNLVKPEIKGWQDNVLDQHPSRWVSFSK